MLNDNLSFWLTACRLRAVSAQFLPDGDAVPAQHFGVFRSWPGHCLRFCQFGVTMSNQESQLWNWLSCTGYIDIELLDRGAIGFLPCGMELLGLGWGGSPLKCDALL